METAQREDLVVQVCSDLFWNEMARPPESRVELSRCEANDLLFSCLLNRQVSWETAMSAMGELRYRADLELAPAVPTEDSLHLLLRLGAEHTEALLFQPPALHRYRYMASYLVAAAEHLRDEWGGDTRLMWADEPTASVLLQRVTRIKGFGPKTGNLLVRILCLQSKTLQLWDGYAGLLPSCDVHVRRVGAVLGLWSEDSPVKVIEAKSREMAPTEPIVMDALFLIGHDWHGDGRNARCNRNEEGLPCPLREVCPQARAFPR